LKEEYSVKNILLYVSFLFVTVISVQNLVS